MMGLMDKSAGMYPGLVMPQAQELKPTVNPTAAGLVDQSMNGGLPGLAAPGQGDNMKAMLWKMLLASGLSAGNAAAQTAMAKKGGGVGGGMGMGGMDLMTLLAMSKMMNGSGTPSSGVGPSRPR